MVLFLDKGNLVNEMVLEILYYSTICNARKLEELTFKIWGGGWEEQQD